VSDNETGPEAQSTIRVYVSDAMRLKRAQLRVSEARGTWVTMSDLMRELLNGLEKAGEESA
jgi:hypothetical protein